MSDVAIVTGADTGIGAAIARQMLDGGIRVLSLARGLPGWRHPNLEAIQVDLLDPHATAAAVADVAARHPVSHVVHNAGAIRPALLEDVALDDLMALTQLHLGAAIQLVQACVPGMAARGFGRVVLMSSRAALGTPTRTAYAATKAGMVGMVRTWALELAPRGITVNAVAPGPIGDTAMFRDIIPPGSAREAALAQAIPVGRLGRTEDVARAVMFFADRQAGFITGQVLMVCGGTSVGGVSL